MVNVITPDASQGNVQRRDFEHRLWSLYSTRIHKILILGPRQIMSAGSVRPDAVVHYFFVPSKADPKTVILCPSGRFPNQAQFPGGDPPDSRLRFCSWPRPVLCGTQNHPGSRKGFGRFEVERGGSKGTLWAHRAPQWTRCVLMARMEETETDTCGVASKHSIQTGAGVIDADYRGPVMVLLFNHSDTDFEGRLSSSSSTLTTESRN